MEFDIVQIPENFSPKDRQYNNESSISVINSATSYNEFFETYMFPNFPCIIKNVTSNWEAWKLWVIQDIPNFEYLQEKYGNSIVIVYNCSERYYNSQKTETSTFETYLEYWQSCRTNPHLHALKYLKDWHLKLEYKGDNFYSVPVYFASDWLNEYYTECADDDYRFVYMGPKNTWTPFHADVFSSYSWSANVCGRKKWVLFRPGDEENLKDELHNLPYDINQINHSSKSFEVIQNPGEAIFVPSGWYHQVWNMDDTISINHNWINGCNIETMWQSMKINLKSVVREIDDCRDMDNFEEQCQVMLNASFGMNYFKFYDFLKFIAMKRIHMTKGKISRSLFNGYILGKNHIIFDLKAIKIVLQDFINCDTAILDLLVTDVEPVNLIENITIIEDKYKC